MKRNDHLISAACLTLMLSALLPVLMCRHGHAPPDYRLEPAWFPHQSHVAVQEMACEDCHGTIEASGSAGDNNLPAVEVCLNCHEPGQAPCTVCDGRPEAPVPGQYRDRNLVFSHEAHLGRGLECGGCHTGIENATGKEKRPFIPSMRRCLECHESRPCERCHTDMGARGFKPKTHDAFWHKAHGLATASEREDCSACHEPGWCQECHRGDIETRYHTKTFINVHGLEARITPGRCDACHQLNFCRNCHGAVNGR
ncbi:cytochrome c3 family protein [Acidobacteriota bacterium]